MRTWLETERKRKGLTMKEMGDALNISESYYSMIESGQRQKNMEITLVAKLSNIFGISIEAIVTFEQARA